MTNEEVDMFKTESATHVGTYFVTIKQDGETARLACETLEEAKMVYVSFLNYGKCEDVIIERADNPHGAGLRLAASKIKEHFGFE